MPKKAICISWDFPGGLVAKTPHSQWRGPGFNPWSGNEIQYAATKSLHAATQDSALRNEDQRSLVPQLRPGQPNKYILKCSTD